MIAELDTLKKTIIIKSPFTLYELTEFMEQHMVHGWTIELAKEYVYSQPYTYIPYTQPSTIGEPWTITSSNGFTGTFSTNGFVGTNTAIGKEQ